MSNAEFDNIIPFPTRLPVYCHMCRTDIPRPQWGSHHLDCPARRSRMNHPSNGRPSA